MENTPKYSQCQSGILYNFYSHCYVFLYFLKILQRHVLFVYSEGKQVSRNSVCLIKMLEYFSSTKATPGIELYLKEDTLRGILPADQVMALSQEKRCVRDGRDGGRLSEGA